MSFINDKVIKYQSFGQSLAGSDFSSMKSALISGFNDDKDTINNCTRLFYKIKSKNKDLIICLRIYIGELNTIFITIPNSMILLYDITSEQTFENVEKWYQEIIKTSEKGISIILVGNKCDLESERKITIEMGQDKARNLNCPFFETSALNSTNIETVFQSISEDIYNRCKNDRNIEDEDDDYEIVPKDDKNININTKTKKDLKCC